MTRTNVSSVPLRWLSKKPAIPAGITWGVPWKQGDLQRDEALAVLNNLGKAVPSQSWPTAYWPDGSVKWTAHAVSLTTNDQLTADSYTLTKGAPTEPLEPLLTEMTAEYLEIDTGAIVCRINRQGASIIRDIVRDGATICSDGRLIGINEQRTTTQGFPSSKQVPFESDIANAIIEKDGPIRTVVKVTGRHRMAGTGRGWLPFTLRLYFYSGQAHIRMMHTFLYDGNPHKDFIKGLGVRFKLPMQGPLYNRYVRVAGDTGFFTDSPKGLLTFRTVGKYHELYKQQFAGKPISFDEAEDAQFSSWIDDLAVWNGYKLVQHTADSYTISKRTKEGCTWVKAASGQRARGLLYAGSQQGGLAVGFRHFWQKSPTSLEADGVGTEEATMTAWMWSPDSDAMDLRHYDTETHLISSYEGFEEMRSTPYGVANTSELTLWCLGSVPEHQELNYMCEAHEDPALLISTPEHYYNTKAAGLWGMIDRRTPLRAKIEDNLDSVFRFYEAEVEQRGWYGFWDYGDIMHSYDPVRHTWRFDLGGCAWQNTELVPNLWLWYMFLRSGRADVFRFAEAMTRHTSEVDLYHIGEYAGLGSRHNVVHWGCGCKEARIGMAALHRYYYYLTADERIGDIMDEVKDSDYATETLDPMRSYYPKDEFPTHVRSGPDWSAFCANWLTQWERHENTFYRDKMLLGIECIKKTKHRLLTGPVFGYEPRTGELFFFRKHENWGHHLMICMGGAQIWIEMADLLNDPVWSDMVAEYGEFYNLPPEEKQRRTNGDIPGKDWNIPMLSTSMMAFGAKHRGDRELGEQAWGYLLNDPTHWGIPMPMQTEAVPELEYIRPIQEAAWMSTNTASQWSLNMMVCLELIGNYLPEGEEG
jgi:hypothetical protein